MNLRSCARLTPDDIEYSFEPIIDAFAGFYFDDFWGDQGPTEMNPYAAEDMGLTTHQISDLTAAYWSNIKVVYAEIVKRGAFSWQHTWVRDGYSQTCPGPVVHNDTCTTDLRSLCSLSSPAQTRAMLYGFYPGNCNTDPKNLTQFQQDLVNFLLIRGPYAWLGHGWLGCDRTYEFPDQLNLDYGEPIGLCKETEVNSSVFVRQWSKATVVMDCNSWTGSIKMAMDTDEAHRIMGQKIHSH